MMPSDGASFSDALQALCLIHSQQFSKALADAWWQALVDLEWPQVQKAMRKLCGSSDWMPKPANVRALCHAIRAPSAGWSCGELTLEALRRGLQPSRTMSKIELLELLDVGGHGE